MIIHGSGVRVSVKIGRSFRAFLYLTRNLDCRICGHMSNSHEDISRFAEIFRALSNPNRLRIFLRMVSCCPPGTKCEAGIGLRQCVGELGRGLEIDSSTVSHHIRELRQSGLIRVERRGKNMLCWVDPETVLQAANLLTGFSLPDYLEDRCVSAGECK
jgi:ArsR family transcriptional regulator, arsenate/arsenite/antimonite-responsive transcriptional repressor